MSYARRTNIEVVIAGKNVTADIEDMITAFSYTDVLEGESDSAQLTLLDRDRLFIDDWFPTRGDTCDIILHKDFWTDNPQILNLNKFEIDEISNTSNNSGNVAQIKLNSVSNKSNLRSVQKNKSWENVKLSKIASDIAESSQLELFYDTKIDPEIERAEQKESANLEFLYNLCKKHYLALKVSDGKLIVFDIEKFESQEPVKQLTYGGGDILDFHGTATISKIYKSCHVKYRHGKQAETFDTTYVSDKESGMTLEVNEKVNSQAEAERLAKCKLKEKNREEWKVRLKVIGDFCYLAGNVISVSGYGKYDGNYMIKQVTHNIGSGYTCSLEIYKVV